MVWYAYAVSPIDIGWEHLPLAEEVTADIARQEAAEVVHEYPGAYGVLEFLSAIKEAKAEARKVGWEGDYRDAPCVFWLPSPDSSDMRYAFIWKQDNNGTTFIVSPFRLPWLE
jgi:hypothetical protein